MSLVDLPDLAQPLSPQELDELDELLLSLGERLDAEHGEEIDCILDVSELDGFLTAIASGPEMVPPLQWLPAVWGAKMPAFASDAEAERVMNLLLRQFNTVATILRSAPETFAPLFHYREVDGAHFEIVDEWCCGYLRGMEVSYEAWLPLVEREVKLFAILKLFGSPEGWQEQEKVPPETLAQLRESIPEVALLIEALWREREAGVLSPQRREHPKIGRNDPCPCGSGKKFKHCCLP